MTRAKQTVSMKNARVLETEVLVPKPKRFVRELVEMPDGRGHGDREVLRHERCPRPCPGCAARDRDHDHQHGDRRRPDGHPGDALAEAGYGSGDAP
jgi:hypothetical protein